MIKWSCYDQRNHILKTAVVVYSTLIQYHWHQSTPKSEHDPHCQPVQSPDDHMITHYWIHTCCFTALLAGCCEWNKWSIPVVVSWNNTGFWLEYPTLQDTTSPRDHWLPLAANRAIAIEQLLAPSFTPLNHAITKSPELSCSKKEAWLDIFGGIM